MPRAFGASTDCYQLRTMKLSTEDQGETSDVVVAFRAWTRQYQVPLPRVGDQLVPEIQPEVDFIVENEELLLTCMRYCREPPLGLAEAFHCRLVWQP